MSAYHKMPRSRKIAGRQHGLKRLTLQNRSAVGCPKVLELWLPESQWYSIDAASFVLEAKACCSKLLGLAEDSIEVEY